MLEILRVETHLSTLCCVSLKSMDQLPKVLGLLKIQFSSGNDYKNIPSMSIYLGSDIQTTAVHYQTDNYSK